VYLTIKRDKMETISCDGHDGVPTLEDLQLHVGGIIDIVNVGVTSNGNRLDLVVNDEGLLIGSPIMLFIDEAQPIAGDVVLIATDGQGETVTLEDEDADRFVQSIGIAYMKVPEVAGLTPVLMLDTSNLYPNSKEA